MTATAASATTATTSFVIVAEGREVRVDVPTADREQLAAELAKGGLHFWIA
uniref:hypothetical protein n=1 Tax=Microbispora cellulosiformans TaxID=2614688 RepID=UPI00177D9739|nr:hypothetical protein [Microbispora cellulosiformans]